MQRGERGWGGVSVWFKYRYVLGIARWSAAVVCGCASVSKKQRPWLRGHYPGQILSLRLLLVEEEEAASDMKGTQTQTKKQNLKALATASLAGLVLVLVIVLRLLVVVLYFVPCPHRIPPVKLNFPFAIIEAGLYTNKINDVQDEVDS